MIFATGILAASFAGWRLYRRIRFFLHIHQLEGYRALPFLGWLTSRSVGTVLRWSHIAGGVILGSLVWLQLPSSVALFLWAIAFSSSRRYRRDRPKKPLVATARLTREAVAATLLTAGVAIGVMWTAGAVIDVVWTAGLGTSSLLPGILLGVLLADLLAPFSVLTAGLMMTPVEGAIRQGFKRLARARLAARPDLTIVAITGSYGKTSVKFAVAEVLAQRFQVLATPGSFNTPMGICKVINNDLRDHHQVLVLEMGIRHPGDIADLCSIARPDIAVVTGVGIAHLESMGSRDAIAREKGTLLSYLRPGGRAILNADDPYFQEMARGLDAWSVSADGAHADFQAGSIAFGPEGTSFSVSGPEFADQAGGERQGANIKMRLLGRHHVGNALLALAVGHAMGIRVRSGAKALARQKPVPHRLSIRTEGELLVLDDAFNSNPVGARNAIEVLSQFSPRRRIVVTPGMIELGDMEHQANRDLGAYMVGRVDDVVLVGAARTVAIAEGLRENGMPPDHVHVEQTLFDARKTVARISSPGDVVLFENDLPDQFTEG